MYGYEGSKVLGNSCQISDYVLWDPVTLNVHNNNNNNNNIESLCMKNKISWLRAQVEADSTLTLLLKLSRNSNKLFVYFLCGSIVHLDKS